MLKAATHPADLLVQGDILDVNGGVVLHCTGETMHSVVVTYRRRGLEVTLALPRKFPVAVNGRNLPGRE